MAALIIKAFLGYSRNGVLPLHMQDIPVPDVTVWFFFCEENTQTNICDLTCFYLTQVVIAFNICYSKFYLYLFALPYLSEIYIYSRVKTELFGYI